MEWGCPDHSSLPNTCRCLRRYARALTGNQASGDAYVGAMLEALLQDASLLDERHGPRAGLFRLFTQIWNSVSLTTIPR